MVSFGESTETIVTQLVKIGTEEVSYNADFIKINGQEVPLSDYEHRLLKCVLNQKGMVATRVMLFRSLYGDGKGRDVKIVDVLVCKLRKKVRAISPEVAEHIAAVWGRGYALADSRTVDSTHWVASKKGEILDNLARGSTTRQRVLAEVPMITEEELDEWIGLERRHGRRGMRVTKTSYFVAKDRYTT